jgi:phospholipid transport system transporter-binding protein
MIQCEGGRCFVHGAVTHAAVATLLAEGERIFQGRRLLFDFSAVQTADSSALSLMLEWVRRASAVGTELEFAGLGPALLSLLQLYGLAELIPLAAE